MRHKVEANNKIKSKDFDSQELSKNVPQHSIKAFTIRSGKPEEQLPAGVKVPGKELRPSKQNLIE